MVVSDTHLLGSRQGHWFDRLRREWQMHRSYVSAVSLHRPQLVLFLGERQTGATGGRRWGYAVVDVSSPGVWQAGGSVAREGCEPVEVSEWLRTRGLSGTAVIFGRELRALV